MLVTIFALAALFGACGGGSDRGTEATAQAKPSPEAKALAVAARLRQGSVPKSLAEPLGVKGVREVKTSDPATGGLVAAVEVTVSPRQTVAPAATDIFAHLEVYEKPLAAVERSRARVARIERDYGAKSLVGGPNSYCGPATLHGRKAWECGGIYGLVFAQALVSPPSGGPPNEDKSRNFALGLMSAMLSYGQENGA